MNALAPTLRATTGMARRVEPEWLDTMPACDPRAARARHDLRRLNHLMCSADILLAGLDSLVVPGRPLRLVELGAGDGWLMLQMAKRSRAMWGDVHLTLVDRHPLADAATLAAFRACGWNVEVVEADVFRWLEAATPDFERVLVANLFLHHFSAIELARLVAGFEGKAGGFVCCEPRRSRWSLAASYLVGMVGCNAITRHDAVVSVRAGFNGVEISGHWPKADVPLWELSEAAAGLFSHRFVARRLVNEHPV